MIGKSVRFKLGNTTIRCVFRHKWDSPENLYTTAHEYRVKKLGIFFRKDMCLRMGNGNPKYSLYPSFTLGLNLIWAKCWIEINHSIHHSEV
jgi:hypothetical protein